MGAEYLALRSRRAKEWWPEPVPTTPLQTPSLQLRAGPGARPTASLDAEIAHINAPTERWRHNSKTVKVIVTRAVPQWGVLGA